jgi:hypothetical protein
MTGALLALLESQTSVFDALAEPAVVGLVGGVLMLAGSAMFGVGEWQRRADSA